MLGLLKNGGCRKHASTYEKLHPSRFALSLIEEERKFLLLDFKDEAIRSFDVANKCLERTTPRQTMPRRQQHAKTRRRLLSTQGLSENQPKEYKLISHSLSLSLSRDPDQFGRKPYNT